MRHSVPGMLCAVMLLVAISGSLHASAIVFSFTDTDNAVFTASGTLTATDNGDGTFTVVSGDGFFNGDPITLIPGSGTSPSGLFIYNNLIYPGGNPLLDVNGLLFRDDVTSAEINVWGNGPFPASYYSTYTGLDGSYPLADTNSVFALSATVPESSTSLLLVTGLGLIAFGWRRRESL